ncbi:MAG: PH domain-containing protein [bacterium]|nr:PH domain-containing protein [Candidatus Sumerlaeota bacterium]
MALAQPKAPVEVPETEMWKATPSLRAAILPTVGVLLALIIIEVIIRALMNWISGGVSGGILGWRWLVYFFVLLVFAGWRCLLQITQHYRLTNKYLYVERGLLSRQTEIVDLRRLRDFDLAEPFLIRIMGLGNIKITSSDETQSTTVLVDLDKPREVLSQFQRAYEKRRPTMIQME